MTAPVHRVIPLKRESTATGGDDADQTPWPELLDENEDGLSAQGVLFQPPQPSSSKDSLVYITRDGAGNLVLKDQNNLALTLTDLASPGGAVDRAWRRHFLVMGA